MFIKRGRLRKSLYNVIFVYNIYPFMIHHILCSVNCLSEKVQVYLHRHFKKLSEGASLYITIKKINGLKYNICALSYKSRIKKIIILILDCLLCN